MQSSIAPHLLARCGEAVLTWEGAAEIQAQVIARRLLEVRGN
jgi:alkylation response protein AidB-like acyl-CoA dehydrogenase